MSRKLESAAVIGTASRWGSRRRSCRSGVAARRARVAWLLAAAAAGAMSSLIAETTLAQSYVSYDGSTTYTQNFDSLGSDGGYTETGGAVSITGGGAGTIIDLGAATYSPTTSATSLNVGGTLMSGWYCTAASAEKFGIADVSPSGSTIASTGALWSYGSSQGSTNRALGLVSAGGSGNQTVGLDFVNTGTTTFNTLDISFDVAQWRVASFANTLTFGYEVASSTSTLPTTGTKTDLNLTYTGNLTNSSGALDGHAAGNFVTLTDTITLSSASLWTPGESLWLTWSLPDVSQGAGIGLDNFSFSATSIAGAEGASLTWNAGSTAWNTSISNTNWLDASSNPAAFANGDSVSFTGAGLSSPQNGNIVIDSGGVTPDEVVFSHNSGTYSVTGGAILGSTGLTMSGSGSLYLGNVNSYTGGTSITAGTLEIASDAALGASNGSVYLDGGAVFRVDSSNSTSSRTFTINNSVGAGGATIDINGNNYDIAKLSILGGNFTKLSAGTLSVGSANFSSSTTTVSIAAGGTLEVGTGTLNMNGTAGGFAGNLILDGTGRLNFNNGSFSGGGVITLNGSGAEIDQSGDTLTAYVANTISLNGGNASGPFVTYIGNSKGTVSGLANYLTLGGPIVGASDVVLASGSSGGAAVLELDAQSSYTGAIGETNPTATINNAYTGVVRLGIDNALPTNTLLVFGAGSQSVGALDLNGFNQTVAGLSSNTTGLLNGITNTDPNDNLATLTINGSVNGNYAGIIGTATDPTNLPPNGAYDYANIQLVLAPTNTGTLTLSYQYSSDYHGGTTVSGGGLIVNTSLSSNASFIVGSNGMLGGNGNVASTVSVNGGKVQPGLGGTDTSALTVAGLSATSGSTFQFALGAPGLSTSSTGTSSSIVVGGALVLPATDGSATLVLTDAGGAGPGYYTLFTYSSYTGGDPASLFTIDDLIPGTTASMVDPANSIEIEVSAAVPEPASLGLLGFGAVALALLSRRRRSKSTKAV